MPRSLIKNAATHSVRLFSFNMNPGDVRDTGSNNSSEKTASRRSTGEGGVGDVQVL